MHSTKMEKSKGNGWISCYIWPTNVKSWQNNLYRPINTGKIEAII